MVKQDVPLRLIAIPEDDRNPFRRRKTDGLIHYFSAGRLHWFRLAERYGRGSQERELQSRTTFFEVAR
jgi:hypothetical protein